MLMGHVDSKYDLNDNDFRMRCKHTLDKEGVLVLENFLQPAAIENIRNEGLSKIDEAYFCVSRHNVYLTPPVEKYSPDHPRNREVVSSKGLIADDQISAESPLKQLYRDEGFQSFICSVVGEKAIFPYADPLSAVNLHFARKGQELGWHFDNSSFAITLLIEKPADGGRFEYVRKFRDADAGEMNFVGVRGLLDGEIEPQHLEINPGDLVLFRGRDSIHRVTATEGNITRMLAVLAYNNEPNVRLSESAMQTFFGRVA